MNDTLKRRHSSRRLATVIGVVGAGFALSSSPAHAGGPASPALLGGTRLEFVVAGRGGVPADAAAAVLNVTATNTEAAGFVTVWPCGVDQPNASNLNFSAGQTTPNLVITKIGEGGKVCVYSQSSTDVIADVAGYFPAGSGYQPVNNPVRILDSRDGVGTTRRKIAADTQIEFAVGGQGGVPPNASAAALNVTATNTEAAGFVTVWPCGLDRPNASNLNFAAGQTTPNLVMAKLGAGGKVCVYSQSATDIIADVAGYFPEGSGYQPVSNPVRILDSRDGLGTTRRKMAADTQIEFAVGSQGGVPPNASAAVLNVTATNTEAAGFVTVWPCGLDRPNASNLNFAAGQTTPNLVIAKLGAGGKVCVYSQSATDIVADVAGYFPEGSGYQPVSSPTRILDTRDGTGVPPSAGQTLSTGGYHTCAVLVSKQIACWGANNFGQLGNGQANYLDAGTPVPSIVVGLRGAVAVSAGSNHTCALLQDTTVSCWGLNGHGQLGSGVVFGTGTPTPVPGLAGVKSISAGHLGTCAVMIAGGAKCWGRFAGGAYEQPVVTAPIVVPDLAEAVEVHVGGVLCARMRNGTIACYPSLFDQSIPFKLGTIEGIANATAVGEGCAIDGPTSAVRCWGLNTNGRLGDGTQVTYSDAPVDAIGMSQAAQVASGNAATCALRAEGSVYCWGFNNFGQTGDLGAGGTSVLTPSRVAGVDGAIAIDLSANHGCALIANGSAFCWGWNKYGQLGRPPALNDSGHKFGAALVEGLGKVAR